MINKDCGTAGLILASITTDDPVPHKENRQRSPDLTVH